MTLKEGIPQTDISLFYEKIADADRIAITGHKNPDGDCVGSCLGLYNYLKNSYPEKTIVVYLEPIAPKFHFMEGAEDICQEAMADAPYDLFITVDCSDELRFDRYRDLYDKAAYRFCIDHHITNTMFADHSIVCADASSASEILYHIFDYEKISKACAECLYTGIAHDTGVFKHSNTSRKTMEAAGALIEKGVNTSFIIDDTFYRKTYLQNQILGKALLESIRILDNRMIFSILYQKDLRLFEVTSQDLDGIIDQMRVTEGVECALFLYEVGEKEYKVSMRSNSIVDVSAIAKDFGGGGHVRAAGCTMIGNPRDIVMNIAQRVEYQLDSQQ